jgi:hypothetical protein
MTTRTTRLWLGWAGILLLAGVTPSCVPTEIVHFDKVGFLDRIRLDRNGLTAAQREDCTVDCERPGEGTFRSASDRLIAELQPAAFGMGAVDLLPQADCLWIAHSSTNGRNTDAIVLHWEAFVELDRDSGLGKRLAPGSEKVAACRFTNPVDRQPICHGDPDKLGEICPPLGPAASNVAAVDSTTLHPPNIPFNVPAEGRWGLFGGDLYIAGAILREQTRAQAPAPGDYNTCDFTPIVGAEAWITQGVKGFDGPSTVDGKVSLCSGLGFRLLPDRDATYRLTCDPVLLGTVAGGGDCGSVGRTLKPNVMVVDGGRRMARRTTQDGALPRRVRWSTPVSAVHGRWQETFTPNVVVSSVRFFRLRSGVETPLDSADFSTGQLCVRENLACLVTCTGKSVAGKGLVFDPFDPASCNAGTLTPTYAVARFAAGLQPARPLTWEIVLAATPADPVYIDFDLRTVGSPPALMAEPPATDFDKLQVGTERQGVVTVSNVGGQTLRIQSVSIQGTWSGDFRARVPWAEQLLPVPVEVVPQAGGGSAVGAAADFEELPLVELLEGEAVGDGRSTLLLREVDHDGGELVAYGEAVAFDGRLALYDNPKANFQATANPPPPKGVSPIGFARRPFGRAVFRDRLLPFNLLPGEAFKVVVTAEPLTTGYDRTATLRVDAVQASDPSVAVAVEAALAVDSISGPTPYVLPQYLELPRPHWNGSRSWQASFLLVNDGETDMVRSQIQLAGAHAARFQVASVHPATWTIAPGDAEHFTIQYNPSPCGVAAIHQAEIRVTTNGGQIVVPLTGNALPCP